MKTKRQGEFKEIINRLISDRKYLLSKAIRQYKLTNNEVAEILHLYIKDELKRHEKKN